MVQRIDAHEKATGKAIYADDIFFANMLFAVPLHAEHPHAEILSIDTSTALKIKGVADVVTAKDVPGTLRVGGIIQDHYIFAKDRCRYAGDVIAMIAADTKEAAYAARDAIKVSYKPLKASFSPEESLKKSSPQIHDECGDNIIAHFKVRHGDVASGFDKADLVIERLYKTQFIEHAYMEPESCVAVRNGDGSVTVYGGMQHPFTTRRFTATFLGLPLAKIRIIQTTLGGGFGGKDDTISVICARAALLALRTGRPVKLTYSREESVRESYKRHPFTARYKAAISKSGKLISLDAEVTADGGPYCSTSPFVIWRPTVQCTGPYLYPNVKFDSRSVYTNNTFTSAMRGFGSPQINFIIESLMDELAAELKIDPVEFRRKNFFTQDCTTHTGQEFNQHKVAINEVVDKTLEKFGWEEKFAKCSRGKPDADGFYHGVGMACSYRGVSLGAEGKDMCAAVVNIQPDGSVLLQVGVAENGQGLKTAMAEICSQELGIPINNVTFLDTDTSNVGDSCPTVASRGTLVGGNAVIDAVRQIKELAAPALVKLLGRSKDGYEFINGQIINRDDALKNISFADFVKGCYNERIYLHAVGSWRGPETSWHEETGKGNAYFTYVYGCQAVEIKIEAKTGKISVLRAVGSHDVGKAVNPQMAMGQIYGGMVMGMGFALKEEIVHKDGVIQNLNFDKYKIPTSTDIPEMEAILVENADKEGPWGAKALGEPVNELMGGAIANAVYYATGVRIRELPITAEKVFGGLRGYGCKGLKG
jgi:CO/xanthine dehydrogenase Mo-binding subunit